MAEQATTEALRYSVGPPRSSIRELFVDFLGSLVPGIAFILAAISGFLLPLFYLIWVFGDHNLILMSPLIPTGVSGQLSLGAVVLLLLPAAFLFLVISYVAGQVFFRQDPKLPDLRSAKLLGEDALEASMIRKTESSIRQEDVEFPYLFLHEYLTQRGMSHLATHVPWRGNDPNTHQWRTKHFMNTLKTRLEFSYPDKVGTIVRNEAHVRLASSMWYICKTVIGISLLGVIIAGGASFWDGYAQGWQVGGWLSSPSLEMVIVPVLVMGVAWRTQRGIENALHYQREREVLFILETAHWASELDKKIDLFVGLTPP